MARRRSGREGIGGRPGQFPGPRARRARAPRALRFLGYGVLGVGLVFVVNGCYQVARKPTDVLGLVAGASPKTPRATWEAYGHLVREHSTEIMRPELLAALIQTESQGDPLARTYWRWRWSWNPLEIYRPASSAVGILQITDGTFAEARRLCVRDYAVAREGPWYDLGACWLNALYMRPVASHSIEMTSAWLHQGVVETLAAQRMGRATPEQQRRLAAVIHLCGKARSAGFARRGFRPAEGERCGDHDLAPYLARIEGLTHTFARLGASG